MNRCEGVNKARELMLRCGGRKDGELDYMKITSVVVVVVEEEEEEGVTWRASCTVTNVDGSACAWTTLMWERPRGLTTMQQYPC